MASMGSATTPEEYLATLAGWQADVVAALREQVLKIDALEEVIKWGHLVYLFNGPALLIRADDDCVMFGFWRGQRMTHIHAGLKAGGKYEMAKLTITKPPGPDAATVRALCEAAVQLNLEFGNPQDAAKK